MAGTPLPFAKDNDMMRFPARIAPDGFGFRECFADLPTATTGLSTYGVALTLEVDAFTTAMHSRLEERGNIPALQVRQVGVDLRARVSATVPLRDERLRQEPRPPHRRRHD